MSSSATAARIPIESELETSSKVRLRVEGGCVLASVRSPAFLCAHPINEAVQATQLGGSKLLELCLESLVC
jgi:hypothetical protein